jgi:hypothetical protein
VTQLVSRPDSMTIRWGVALEGIGAIGLAILFGVKYRRS